jgi:hypothetical protein
VAVVLGFRVLFLDLPFTDAFKGYLIAVIIFNLIYIIFSVIAAVRAYNGRMYYFIFFGRISYMNAFKKREEYTKKYPETLNKPPQL